MVRLEKYFGASGYFNIVKQSEQSISNSKVKLDENALEILIREDLKSVLIFIEDKMVSPYEVVVAILFDPEHRFLGHIYCWVNGSVIDIVGIRASTFSIASGIHGISTQIL